MPDRDGERFQSEAHVEHLGTEIINSATELAAATARWLQLVAEFDRSEGWRPSGCHSCSHWLSWKCGIAPTTGREQVRVARALETFPVIAAAFSAGELTYCKVRALVRMATPATEADLVELAKVATGAHLARIAKGYARAASDPLAARRRQAVQWHWDDDGDLVVTAKLPADTALVFLRAMQVSADHLSSGSGDANDAAASSGNREPDERRARGAAEVFAAMATLALVGAIDEVTGPPPPEAVLTVAIADLSSTPDETTGTGRDLTRPRIDHHVARRICCDATTATLLHDSRGTPIDLGRRQRTVNHALRTALHLRDGGCRFPGCDHTRFVNAHHIVHWADGGSTELSNLLTLCTFHHRLLHEGGYTVTSRPDGTHSFRRCDGSPMIDQREVTTLEEIDMRRINRRRGIAPRPDALVPTWAGEHLDLGLCIDAILWTEQAAQRHSDAAASPAA